MSLKEQAASLRQKIKEFNKLYTLKRKNCDGMPEDYYKGRRILDAALQDLLNSPEYKQEEAERKALNNERLRTTLKFTMKSNEKVKKYVINATKKQINAGRLHDRNWNNARVDKIPKFRQQARELSALVKHIDTLPEST